MSNSECDDFFNFEEVNELSEIESENEDEISNINKMQKTWKFLNLPTSEDDIVGDGMQAYSAIRSVLRYILGKHRDDF